MSLYRLTTYAGGHLYAKRHPSFALAIVMTPHKGSATLFPRDEARAIKKRLSRKPVRMKIKLEVA